MSFPRWILVPAALLALLPSCISTPAGVLPLGGAPAANAFTQIEAEIVALVNRERAAHGLPQLAPDPRIAALAREHSREMARGARPFGHDRFRERASAVRSIHAGGGAVSENVAARLAHPPHAAHGFVRDWIASASHRDAILDASHHLTGIGVWQAPNGEMYATQLFLASGRAVAVR